ncbi:MAG: ATP-binding protein [Lachnospiraceae bacterium]|nr:ATP-binding protein [Lachnospiraceae bacterium]
MALTNEQFQKISRIYEERRMNNDYQLMHRKEEIYKKIPAYHDLDRQIADLSMACSRALISDADDMEPSARLAALRSQILDLRLAKKRLLEENGYPRDYLEPSFVCSKCRDTGFIEGEKCSCFKQYEISYLYASSNLHQILESNNFSLLSRHYYTSEEALEHFDKAVENCHRFIEAFGTEYRNMVFYGTVGTGKSFLSGCIAKELLDRGTSILYFSAIQLFQSLLNASYSSDKTELNHLYDTLFASDLLIIDDLGSEHITDYTRSQLFQILNERSLRKKPFLLSTNHDLQELREEYSDRIFSRLVDNSYICHLTGQDIRMKKKIENDHK